MLPRRRRRRRAEWVGAQIYADAAERRALQLKVEGRADAAALRTAEGGLQRRRLLIRKRGQPVAAEGV